MEIQVVVIQRILDTGMYVISYLCLRIISTIWRGVVHTEMKNHALRWDDI